MANKQTMNQKQAEKAKGQKPEHSVRAGLVALDLFLSLAVVGTVGFYLYRVGSSFEKIDMLESSTLLAASGEESSQPEAEGDQSVYDNVFVKTDAVYSGDLILVNNDTEYHSGQETDLVNLYEKKTDHYHLSGTEMMLREEAVSGFNALMDAFYVASGRDDIIVISGYRTKEEQQGLYDEDLQQTGADSSSRVSLPGHSEHESGYAVDLSLFTDGVLADYDGTGDYAWINENCAKYGFVLRYTEQKQPITGIEPEPWHYRYVGQPHATYMTEHDLCLEEYLDSLRQYSAENPLTIENWDGELYQVYFVPADMSADGTYALIPTNASYTISGNNKDGYIVTVDTGEIQSFDSAADSSTDSAAESESTAEAESEPADALDSEASASE